jgi:BirA family transcriptional regulator, biotin operon repressor / biotin---[acetyl-CoA-carboxylase] ligase
MSGGGTSLRLPPAFRLVALASVGSTNEEARRLAREGAEDGTIVWAREQSSGRGRRGRGWSSPPGNLYCSLVLRPDCPPGEAAQLGFIAALAVGETCGGFVPPLVELHHKWPNDVLLGGRKVSGILLESESDAAGALDWLVLGVGINVASAPEGTEFPATSLHAEGAGDIPVEPVLEAFSRHFLSWVDRWLADGFPPVRAAWKRRAWRLGEEIVARLPNEEVRGRFEDLDETGALVLSTAAGRRRITAGEVFA